MLTPKVTSILFTRGLFDDTIAADIKLSPTDPIDHIIDRIVTVRLNVGYERAGIPGVSANIPHDLAPIHTLPGRYPHIIVYSGDIVSVTVVDEARSGERSESSPEFTATAELIA